MEATAARHPRRTPARRIWFSRTLHSYVECSVPVSYSIWSRVVARDPWTFEVLALDSGLLHFISPYITSVPAHSIVMTDLVRVFEAGSCDCGNRSPWFEILGRAGTSRNRSCAIAATELLAAP